MCNVAGYCVDELADSTLSMILNLLRRTHWLAASVQSKLSTAKQQHFSQQNATNLLASIAPSTPEQIRDLAQGSTRIRGQTLGLIGFGRTGIAVAQRAKAFGLAVLFYDPNVADGMEKSIGGVARCASLAELLQQSDCVSLQCPLNESTYHVLNEQTFKQMKAGAMLVNTANASLVDDVALANALKSGQLKGAALDAFQIESFHPVNGPLKDAPNLMVTPHAAFYSDVSSREMREMAAQEVRRGLISKAPFALRNCVNRDLVGGLGGSNGVASAHRSSPAAGVQSTPVTHAAAAVGNSNNPLAMLGSAAGANSNANAQLLAQLSCKCVFFFFVLFSFYF